MLRNLVLPDDFRDFSWEVELKGVFWDAVVIVGDVQMNVVFYDPVRLAQDVQEDLGYINHLCALKRVLVVSKVTEEEMRAAVANASDDFFK